MKFYIHRKILIGFIVSMVIILGLGLTSYLYFNKMITIIHWGSHARKVLYHAEQLKSITLEIETSQRGYVITGQESFLKPYRASVAMINSHLHELDSLTSDNASQGERMIKLRDAMTRKINFAGQVVQIRKESFEKARDLVLTLKGDALMDEMLVILNEIQDEENNLILERSITTRRQFIQFVVTFSGLIVCTLLILAGLTYMINSNLKSRTMAEEKMKQAEQDAWRVNSELEAFSYSVSHDLRAPLRSVNGYAQILKDDYGIHMDEEGNRLIEVIKTNGERMGQLIDDLLAFSRVGRQEMKKSTINMNEFVKSIYDELTRSMTDRKIELNMLPLGNAPADVSLIRQVWVNLISNALKYSQKKDVSRIEVGMKEENTEYVYYIKDNGVGFNMQYGNKLFGVFQRLHKAKDFEGTGVGLALAKRIIDRHKGRIWAEAILNEGATFFFSLPKQS